MRRERCGGLFLLFLSVCAERSPGTTAGLELRPLAQTPYWEVIPQLSSGDGRALTLQEVMHASPNHLLLSLPIEGMPIRMELQRNRLLMPGAHTFTYDLPDGSLTSEHRAMRVNCYYHGRVVGGSGPWSGLSLCSGLRGSVVLGADQHFSIEPLPHDEGGSFRHAFRRLHGDRNHTCEMQDSAHNDKSRRRLLSMGDPQPNVLPRLADTPTQRAGTDVVSETKYVELVMVADNSEYQLLQRDLNRLHARMLEIANKMDAFYRALNVRVTLVGVEVWNQKDRIAVSTDPTGTLDRFLSWRETELLPRLRHDNAQLLTGVTFQGSAAGMATMNSICTKDRSGGVNMDHSVSILSVASTVAHQLGHNLGLRHDAADKECGQPRMGKEWIMEKSAGFMPGLEFSRCSLEDLSAALRRGGGKCLFNVPPPTAVYGEPRCGNMVVERGEQCDCGLALECSDPCCNASSCQLVTGAECASDGLCCERCKIRPAGTLCREPLEECDLPEYCSGASPHCPANVYLQDGAPCAQGRAHCYEGECRTLEAQCRSLWGPGFSPVPEPCFTKLNTRGDKYGNCGRQANGTYLPCTPRNAPCGSLQCMAGKDRPLLGAVAENITDKVTVNGSQVTCRSTYYNPGEDVWEAVLVKAGTACGAGKVCVRQQCQDTAALRAETCTSKCGGHGVCNSNNNCHCEVGWAPPDCARSGDGGSVDSGSVALQHGSSSASTAIFLALLLLIVLVLFATCFVKRHFLQRKLAGIFSKSSKCQYRVTQSGSQPRPQRPPPPQRTQSTELQVMSPSNQSPHSPLSLPEEHPLASSAQSDMEGDDRPDPPSKPLPPDPVPKHQQADVQERPPAPNRPLPADPRPPRTQVPNPGKPPPPKKPLPLKPTQPCQDPLLGVPTYPERIIALPSRHAPPPPYSGWNRRV